MPDASPFDRDDILARLFHPRPGLPVAWETKLCFDLFIPTHDDKRMALRCHLKGAQWPTLLFFHGNGEVASDYDDVAPHFTDCGFNLIIAEYRGYGLSLGEPTLAHMLTDARTAFVFIEGWLKSRQYTGPMAVMGRSLGSAAALELAAAFPTRIDALVLESGFARIIPLLHVLGIPQWETLPLESEGPCNLAKMGAYHGKVVVIHAHEDTMIPFSEGEALYHASPSQEKSLLGIENAGHNDIFYVGHRDYLDRLRQLSLRLFTPAEHDDPAQNGRF